MFALVATILMCGILALVASGVLLAHAGFERFIGLRYLRRGRVTSGARAGLAVAVAVVGIGVALLALGHGRARDLETAGVMLTLVGALLATLFLLLRIFSVFTTVSTLGVVLGVASLVVVMAVTSGFEREFEDKVLAVNAHAIVMGYGDKTVAVAEQEADGYMRKLADLPGLRRMAKFSLSAGEVMVGRVGANLKGIDLKTGADDLRRALVAGRVEDLDRPARCAEGEAVAPGRIILGAELFRKLHRKLGDCVQVLVPFARGEVAERSSHAFQIVGVFRMGFHEYDTRLGYVNIEDARRLGSERQQLFGVELRFDDPKRALAIDAEIAQRLGVDVHVMDWRTLNNNMFTALAMQKAIIGLILAIIIVVAAFNIVASLMLIVRSKTSEIAILRSMGARARAMVRVFLVAGSVVGAVGTSLGILYGVLVCVLVNAYGYSLDSKVYLIERLPVRISASEILFVAAGTQLICFLATIYPAVRAGRMKVIEGLRYT